jgi:hypothetical protein
MLKKVGLDSQSSWGDQTRMARLLGVHRSTISRDVQWLYRECAEAERRARGVREFQAACQAARQKRQQERRRERRRAARQERAESRGQGIGATRVPTLVPSAKGRQ